MEGRTLTRRAVVGPLLLVALALSAMGWTGSPGDLRRLARSVTSTGPPGSAIEAALSVNADLVKSGWAEQRVLKLRPRLGLVGPEGLGLLVAAAMVALVGLPVGRRPSVWRRRSVPLRAPPRPRLS